MDDQWVERLVQNNKNALLGFLQRHVTNREDAQDLLQDVFTACYRHKESFDPERCSETAWLYVIAKNRLKQYYRDQKQISSLEELSENGQEPADWSAQEAASLMECRDLTAKLLLTLDERSRTVLILRYFQDLDSQQIAQRMGLSPTHVRVIQSRAIASLRQAMEQMKDR
ncbi:MAG: RNA polymerase sigma factor [Faecalibacterium sp.]